MTKQAHKRNSREAVWRAVAGVLGVLLLIWALLPLLRHPPVHLLLQPPGQNCPRKPVHHKPLLQSYRKKC